MQLKNSIKSIAIGSFDGIHKAHQVLISQAEAVVVIERNGGYLTPGYKRSNYFSQPCFFYHFEHISFLRAEEFVTKLCEDFPKIEKIVVGYDFGFGFKKEGNVALLRELFRGEVLMVEEVKENGVSVHSRTIKRYIEKGQMEEVNHLLGRAYEIEGRVVQGQGLGKKELVPTINLNVYDYVLPKNGVYATRTNIENEWFESISFLGIRETTDGAFAIETYIIKKDILINNHKIKIEFIAYIRENRKFPDLKSLKNQILLDINRAKKIFKDL